MVYGGNNLEYVHLSSGFVFETEKKEIRPILGKSSDLKLGGCTQVQWIGEGNIITLANSVSDNHLHMVRLNCELKPNDYAETRSFMDCGHAEKDDYEAQLEQQRLGRIDELGKEIKDLCRQKSAKISRTDE